MPSLNVQFMTRLIQTATLSPKLDANKHYRKRWRQVPARYRVICTWRAHVKRCMGLSDGDESAAVTGACHLHGQPDRTK